MQKPKWAREIERFISIKPQFLLWGNIYDVYPIELDDRITTMKLTDYLSNILIANSYDLVVEYQPLIGFTILKGAKEEFNRISEEKIKETLKASLPKANEIIEKFVNSREISTSIILNFSSRLENIAKNDIEEFFYKQFRLLQNATPKITPNHKEPKFNPIFWLIDKENDLPTWYNLDNPKLKTLPIPKPDFLIRKIIIEKLSQRINGFNQLEERKQKENISLFIDQTNNLYANEIISIITLAIRDKIDFYNINEAIKSYKLGIIENEWAKISKEKILNAKEKLKERVKGQDLAINRVTNIIKRAYFNLSGSQFSKFSNRPKGVLFFAGPTGVGKTELAKAITKLIFGSEQNYIRFDMSEFAKEHSDQRLIGAPPGYVGYEMGGELTNAIKQNPFSVILFDEIEKANPKILDIFLQILDDGRLTSSRGERVYFSEALIIFTSNLGIYDIDERGNKIQKVSSEMPYQEMSRVILNSIEEYFKYKLQRPEILNRIGKNIIIFDFIRVESAKEIFIKMLKNILENVKENYNITISFSKEVKEKLLINSIKDLSMGGRGIGNLIEEIFINPLSSLIFELDAKSGDKIFIENIEKREGEWELKGIIVIE